MAGPELVIGGAYTRDISERLPIHQTRSPAIAQYFFGLGIDPLSVDTCGGWPALAYAALEPDAKLMEAFSEHLGANFVVDFRHANGSTISDLFLEETRETASCAALRILAEHGQFPSSASKLSLLNRCLSCPLKELPDIFAAVRGTEKDVLREVVRPNRPSAPPKSALILPDLRLCFSPFQSC